MSISNNIGLAVSGCKNGYAVFGTAGNLDRNSLEVKGALRDMRAYIRVAEPGKVFYSMEYLDRHIVYGVYRSSIDSVGSTGAYIAVHLFVPCTVRVDGLASLLDRLLDAYWTDFMHPMFGSPLPGKIEDISRLSAMLESAQAGFHELSARYSHRNSDPSALPLYIGYRAEGDVERIFSNPFHAAYYRASRVILVPAAMLDDPKADNVLFNTDVQTILPQHGRAEGLLGSLTVPLNINVRMAALTVDGRDVLSAGEDYSLTPDSAIHYELKIPGRRIAKFTGTLQQALDQKLIRKAGGDYEIMPVLIEVRAAVKGAMRSDCLPVLISDTGKEYRIKNLPGGHAGWLVPSDGFPYALGIYTPQRSEKVRDNFVNAATVSSTPYPVDMNELASAGDVNRPPSLQEYTEEKLVEQDRSRLFIIIGAAVAVAALCFCIWWFWLRDEEEPGQEIVKEETVQYPDSTMIVIDKALLPGAEVKWESVMLDSITQGGVSLPYKEGQPLTIVLRNKSWREGNRSIGDTLPVYFLDAAGKSVFTLKITPEMVDSMSDLKLYPKNTSGKFFVSKKSEQTDKQELMDEVMGNLPPKNVAAVETEDIAIGAIEDENPEEKTLTPEEKIEKIRRAKLRAEVEEVIKALQNDPSKDNITRASELMKQVENGQKPRLKTALDKAVRQARANAAKGNVPKTGNNR